MPANSPSGNHHHDITASAHSLVTLQQEHCISATCTKCAYALHCACCHVYSACSLHRGVALVPRTSALTTDRQAATRAPEVTRTRLNGSGHSRSHFVPVPDLEPSNGRVKIHTYPRHGAGSGRYDTSRQECGPRKRSMHVSSGRLANVSDVALSDRSSRLFPVCLTHTVQSETRASTRVTSVRVVSRPVVSRMCECNGDAHCEAILRTLMYQY